MGYRGNLGLMVIQVFLGQHVFRGLLEIQVFKASKEFRDDLTKVGKTAGVAFASLSAGIAFAVKEAAGAEKVDARLTQTLKNMGITSAKAADQLKTLAAQMQKTTKFSDDDLKKCHVRSDDHDW